MMFERFTPFSPTVFLPDPRAAIVPNRMTHEETITQLLTNIAREKGNQELVAFIQSRKGRDLLQAAALRYRIRAIRQLVGDNREAYLILSKYLSRESLDELVEAFMQMLDNLTPYYQAKMQALSQQQQKIIGYLSDRRGAVTVKEIAVN